jgi:hypothetical protein
VRRPRRTVKRSVNRSSCACKSKVCFSRVVVCGVVCTFSVLEGLPKLESSKKLPCALSTPEALEV